MSLICLVNFQVMDPFYKRASVGPGYTRLMPTIWPTFQPQHPAALLSLPASLDTNFVDSQEIFMLVEFSLKLFTFARILGNDLAERRHIRFANFLKPATVNFRGREVAARAFQFVWSNLPAACAVFRPVTARQVAGKASGGSDGWTTKNSNGTAAVTIPSTLLSVFHKHEKQHFEGGSSGCRSPRGCSAWNALFFLVPHSNYISMTRTRWQTKNLLTSKSVLQYSSTTASR